MTVFITLKCSFYSLVELDLHLWLHEVFLVSQLSGTLPFVSGMYEFKPQPGDLSILAFVVVVVHYCLSVHDILCFSSNWVMATSHHIHSISVFII
jgi:hypothetical protein